MKIDNRLFRALAKFGNIIVDMRGSINGNTYSQNKAGAYVRTKVTPNNPQTIYQQEVRSQFQQISQSWNELGQEQRIAWNAAAPDWSHNNVFGDNKPLSGFGLYVKINLNCANAGLAGVDVPPAQVEVAGSLLTGAEVESDGAPITLSFVATPTAADVYHLVYATAPYSPGKTNVNNRYRLIGVIPPASATVFTVASQYTAKFGIPSDITKVISFKLKPIFNEGQPGTTSTYRAIIEAP